MAKDQKVEKVEQFSVPWFGYMFLHHMVAHPLIPFADLAKHTDTKLGKSFAKAVDALHDKSSAPLYD